MKKTIKFLRANRHSFFVSLIAIVLPILGSLLSLYIIFSYPEITEWIKDHSILFFIGTAFTMAILLTPTTFIASLSGFLFGLSSLVYVVPAYLLASLLGYMFGRNLDKGRLLKSMVDMDDKELFVWLGSAAQNLIEALSTGNGNIGFKFYMTAILVIVSSFGLIYLFKRKLRQLKSL